MLTRNESGAWHGEIKGARDVALCVSPDYKLAVGRQGSAAVYSYAKTEAGAKRALEYAQKALETYGSLYGAYPYPALTICSVDFPFGGMEYPGLCMIGEGNYLDSKAETLELTIAHETAHQWFYALVLSDQVKSAWQDEATAEYAVILYARKVYGDDSGERIQYQKALLPMEQGGFDVTPGAPIGLFGDSETYLTLVYGHGCAYLCALDTYLDGRLPAFLRAYLDAFAYGFATRADFENQLQIFSETDLSALTADFLDTY